MEERQQMDKRLRDLIEIIHFTEHVSAKIHRLLDDAEIYRTVKEEFAQSKRYATTILLLTDDESKLRIAETSTAPDMVKAAEKVTGLRLREYKIDLKKSSVCSQVIEEGKTVQASVSDIIGELFPRPLAHLIPKILGLEKALSILTPLKRHGKIIGALSMTSTELAEHFIPSVRNLARHISSALELADENAERKRAEAKRAYRLEMERVLGQVSNRFMDLQNLDQTINEMLKDTSTVLNANRAYQFKIYDDGAKMSNTHEWVAEGITPQIENLQGLDTDVFPWWMSKLYNNEVIAVSDISQLPSPEKEMLEEQGILSILVVPIFTHGTLHGFFGFDETRRHREWESEETGLLRNAGEILGRALERTQARQALQRHNLELAALNVVADTLASSLELQDLLDEALSRTVATLGFAGGLVALDDEHTGELALFSHTRLPRSLVEHLEIHGLSGTLCDFVYREGMSLGLRDLREGAPVGVPELLKVGLQSYMGTPIAHKARTLGAICLFDTAPHPVSESDHALLTAIGRQVGVAVENARLFQDIARERQVARTLLDTAEALSTTLQLDKLLERVLDELQRVVPYDAASINLLRDGRCRIIASRGLEQVPSDSKECDLDELPPVQRVVRERGPVIVPDVHEEPGWLPVEGLGPVRSWLGVPLIYKDRVIGVLMMDSHHPDTYDEEAAHLVFAFSRQVAMAMENARLYEQTRAQLREANLLHGVTAALSSSLAVDQILPYVARSLCEALNGTSAEIYSLNEEANTVTVVAEYAIPRSVEDELRWDLGRTYALAGFPATAEALAQRCPMQVRVDDPEADPRGRAELKAHAAQAMLLLPMVVRDRVVGFAGVWESQGPRHFTKGEIALGQTLANQAAIALENARLYEAAQRELAERVQAEKALRRLKEFNEGIVQGVAEALCVEDADGIITFVNPAMEGLLGYAPGELVGQHWQTTVPSEEVERVQEKRSHRLAGVSERYETRLRAKDGREIPVLANARPLFEGEVFTGVLGAFTDITERKREEEAQKRFISNVSHELRTPVHNIRSSITLLRKYEQALLPVAQKERLLAAIDSESKRLGELIEDVLTLSRLDRSATMLRRKEADLNVLLRQACDHLQSALGRWSGIARQALPDRPILVEIDPSLMLQVAVNLLDNAIKYSPEGDRITLTSGQGETEAWFSIQDEGVGMTGEQIEQIFDRFYRVTSAHETSGAGIGLAVAKEIVKLHDGRIEVQSEPGQGSCFTVYLPVSVGGEK